MKYIIAGILGGIIGGMGMGGGTLLIPILTLMLSMSQKSAQLINTLAFIPMAIVTIILNAKAGLIKWKYLIYVGIPGTIASVGSSFLVGHIEGKSLRIAFGVFLLVLAICFLTSTIWKMWKKKQSETLTSINVTKDEDTE